MIENAEREAQDQSDYITLKAGEHAILDFDLSERPPEFKQDTFKGQPGSLRWFFYAKQLDCTNSKKSRLFKVNNRSGKAILAKIKELDRTVLRIDREGDDDTTFYRPSVVPTDN